MRPRKKDPAFLRMAVIAATGGVLNIGFTIGLAIWTYAHGKPYSPFFSLFSIWGIAALMGAYACLATYRLSDTTGPRPPRGGIHLEVIHGGAPPPPPPAYTTESQAA